MAFKKNNGQIIPELLQIVPNTLPLARLKQIYGMFTNGSAVLGNADVVCGKIHQIINHTQTHYEAVMDIMENGINPVYGCGRGNNRQNSSRKVYKDEDKRFSFYEPETGEITYFSSIEALNSFMRRRDAIKTKQEWEIADKQSAEEE